MISNVVPVTMPSPEHGEVVPLEELRAKSDREKQLLKFDALAGHWNKFDSYRTLEGRNLDALEALYNEFCGGEA